MNLTRVERVGGGASGMKEAGVGEVSVDKSGAQAKTQDAPAWINEKAAGADSERVMASVAACDRKTLVFQNHLNLLPITKGCEVN